MIVTGPYSALKTVYQSGNANQGGFRGFLLFTALNGSVVTVGSGFRGSFQGGDTIWVLDDPPTVAQFQSDFDQTAEVTSLSYSVHINDQPINTHSV